MSLLLKYPCNPALYFTGNVCRDSDRSGSVKLFWVEAEAALLPTWVQNHSKYLCYRVSFIYNWHKCFESQTSCVFSCTFLSLFPVTLPSLLGVDKVIQYAVTEWLTDIRKNQLPGILGGVGPMHSVVQLCELTQLIFAFSAKHLHVFLFCFISWYISFSALSFSPWSERSVLVAHWAVQERWTHYSRSPEGGSLLWHLYSICCSGAQQQAGAGHTGTESVHVFQCTRSYLALQKFPPKSLSLSQMHKYSFCFVKVVSVCDLQATAETVYDILSPTPPLNRYAITEGRAPSSRPRRAAQPADLREGVAKAYDTVREVRPQTYPSTLIVVLHKSRESTHKQPQAPILQLTEILIVPVLSSLLNDLVKWETQSA